MIRKIFAVITVVIIILSTFIMNTGAYDASEATEYFSKNNNEIICIAHRGDWHNYPENSAEAVKTAAEYGVVSVDIKVTSDNKVILMADDTVDRMCVDDGGKTVTGNVKDFTLEQLQKMYLRSANGTEKNAKTDFHPASLEEAATALDGSAALMLNLKCADFKTVYETVKVLKITDKVVFRFSDKNKNILETVKGADDITACGNYQGNIIFLATSAVKSSLTNGLYTVELGSKNGHGVLYDSFLMNRFDENGKAMASMVNGRCGKRTDNEIGWDDLISRGYSVIETDYPAELTEYLETSESVKDELERIYSQYRDTDTTPFTTDTEDAFISALTEAEKLVNGFGSRSEYENARFNLQTSFDNLTVGEKKAVTLSFDFSIGKLIAAVLCGAAILTSQILLYKRREKKN